MSSNGEVSRFPNTQRKRVAANTWGKSAEMSLRVSKYLDYTLYLAIMGIIKSLCKIIVTGCEQGNSCSSQMMEVYISY